MNPTGERGVRVWLTRHWPLKLLAIALAFGAWLVVTTDNRTIQDYTVSVEARFASDLVPVGDDRLKQVIVRLRGSAAQFRRFEPSKPSIHVDLTGAEPGERSVRIQPNDLQNVPSNLEIVMIEPPVLTYTLARKASAELPVVAKLVGDPADGHELYGVDVDPDRVRVSGPAEEVAMLDHVGTDPVELSGRRESFTVRVAPNPDAENVTVDGNRELTVRVRVDEDAARRTFNELPVRVAGADPERIRISPPTLSVEIRGPARILEKLGSDQIRLSADVSGLTPRRRPYTVPVTLAWSGVPEQDRPWLKDPGESGRTIEVRIDGREDDR